MPKTFQSLKHVLGVLEWFCIMHALWKKKTYSCKISISYYKVYKDLAYRSPLLVVHTSENRVWVDTYSYERGGSPLTGQANAKVRDRERKSPLQDDLRCKQMQRGGKTGKYIWVRQHSSRGWRWRGWGWTGHWQDEGESDRMKARVDRMKVRGDRWQTDKLSFPAAAG